MHIAITGGSGRVGRAVMNLALAQGHQVTNIDRTIPAAESAHPQLTYIQTETTDYTALENALHGCEALIHLAAIPSPRGHAAHVVHNNNVVASYNALQAAAQLGIQRVCQASSINAIGGAFSRWPHYDYFPLDEQHPTYNEDSYSLSKWICEQQADALARHYENMSIASLRLHGIVPNRDTATSWVSSGDYGGVMAKQLWGYTNIEAAAAACLLTLTAPFIGHEVFYIVAPDTMAAVPSSELKAQYYPEVPLRTELHNQQGFFDCRKAEQMLGWRHQ